MVHKIKIWSKVSQYFDGFDFIDLEKDGQLYCGIITAKEGELKRNINIIKFKRLVNGSNNTI